MREIYYSLDNLLRVEVGDDVGEDELYGILQDHFRRTIGEWGPGDFDLLVQEDVPMDGDGEEEEGE